jgi:hypothetical protein
MLEGIFESNKKYSEQHTVEYRFDAWIMWAIFSFSYGTQLWKAYPWIVICNFDSSKGFSFKFYFI